MPTTELELSEAYLTAKNSLKEDSFDFDADICEIFVEEADEVLETLSELLPVWQRDPSNLKPLTDIRRGFHTLKGSGRMVGANNLGEMAWAVENMLNRVLDGTIASTPTVANFVGETATLIPTLVRDFDTKQAPSIDPAIVVLKANNILAGNDVNAGMPVAKPMALATVASTAMLASETVQDAQAVQADDEIFDEPSIQEVTEYVVSQDTKQTPDVGLEVADETDELVEVDDGFDGDFEHETGDEAKVVSELETTDAFELVGESDSELEAVDEIEFADEIDELSDDELVADESLANDEILVSDESPSQPVSETIETTDDVVFADEADDLDSKDDDNVIFADENVMFDDNGDDVVFDDFDDEIATDKDDDIVAFDDNEFVSTQGGTEAEVGVESDEVEDDIELESDDVVFDESDFDEVADVVFDDDEAVVFDDVAETITFDDVEEVAETLDFAEISDEVIIDDETTTEVAEFVTFDDEIATDDGVTEAFDETLELSDDVSFSDEMTQIDDESDNIVNDQHVSDDDIVFDDSDVALEDIDDVSKLLDGQADDVVAEADFDDVIDNVDDTTIDATIDTTIEVQGTDETQETNIALDDDVVGDSVIDIDMDDTIEISDDDMLFDDNHGIDDVVVTDEVADIVFDDDLTATDVVADDHAIDDVVGENVFDGEGIDIDSDTHSIEMDVAEEDLETSESIELDGDDVLAVSDEVALFDDETDDVADESVQVTDEVVEIADESIEIANEALELVGDTPKADGIDENDEIEFATDGQIADNAIELSDDGQIADEVVQIDHATLNMGDDAVALFDDGHDDVIFDDDVETGESIIFDDETTSIDEQPLDDDIMLDDDETDEAVLFDDNVETAEVAVFDDESVGFDDDETTETISFADKDDEQETIIFDDKDDENDENVIFDDSQDNDEIALFDNASDDDVATFDEQPSDDNIVFDDSEADEAVLFDDGELNKDVSVEPLFDAQALAEVEIQTVEANEALSETLSETLPADETLALAETILFDDGNDDDSQDDNVIFDDGNDEDDEQENENVIFDDGDDVETTETALVDDNAEFDNQDDDLQGSEAVVFDDGQDDDHQDEVVFDDDNDVEDGVETAETVIFDDETASIDEQPSDDDNVMFDDGNDNDDKQENENVIFDDGDDEQETTSDHQNTETVIFDDNQDDDNVIFDDEPQNFVADTTTFDDKDSEPETLMGADDDKDDDNVMFDDGNDDDKQENENVIFDDGDDEQEASIDKSLADDENVMFDDGQDDDGNVIFDDGDDDKDDDNVIFDDSADEQENENVIFDDDDVIFDDDPADELQADESQVASEQMAVANLSQQTDVTPVAKQAGAGLPDVLVPFMAEAKQMPAPAVEDVDDDIKEIYIEEANEVLETIIPLFDKWQSNKDKAVLTDVRRGFHTLKGSGRMVGAVELGELAWSIENMLNRVLDGTVVPTDGMVALIEDVLLEFAELVALFEQNSTDYPEELTLWIAVAHAYSKGHGNSFDYRQLLVAPTQDESQTETPLADSDGASDGAGLDLEAVTRRLSDVVIHVPSDEEEQKLCQTFIDEVRELLVKIDVFVDSNMDKESVSVNDDIVRAFHTLRGGLALESMQVVGELASIVEENLQHLQRHDADMTTKQLQALGATTKLIETHLRAYELALAGEHQETTLGQDALAIGDLLQSENQSIGGSDMDVSGLIDGLDTLLDVELELESVLADEPQAIVDYTSKLLVEIELLEARTLSSTKFQKLLLSMGSAYQMLNKHPEQASDDGLVDGLLAVQTELIGLFDSLAGSMSLRLNDGVVRALDAKVSDIQGYYNAIEKQDLILGHKADESALPSLEYQDITTDPDLLEIFLEEASELDTAITEVFGQWREDTSNAEALKALQRHLHTIKGGARLAGISSIGDLTHEAETVYEQLVDGRLAVSDGWVRIMQGVQDILSLQIDEVRKSKRSFFATKTVEELQAFLQLPELPADARITPLVAQKANVTPAKPETTVSEQKAEPVSDFEYRQLQSWQGNLPDSAILAVFLEEAEELVESSSEDFAVLRSNTSDLATLQSLQRKLHTIKGGARMVSANGVADLAHNMETVYEDLGSRRRPATRMVIQLLLSCHDWLAGAVVLLKSTLNPPTPLALIEALGNFSRRPDSLTEVPVVSLAEELEAIAAYEAYEKQRRGGRDISRMPPASGMFEQSEELANSNEMIRISAGLMEQMINLSGEAAINRARIDMSMTSLTASIEEMGVTVQRLADQLRRMDIELEAQILAQIDDKSLFDHEGFDPLEMDQYSSLNQLSKSLSESASDLLDLKATLLEKTRDGENLLLQLSRTQNELQDGLMYSRMVPFSRLTPRLQRIVRQVSTELGKSVELSVVNADDEMDRTILERITSPLEHMLRNAIDHGIEMPEERSALGKPQTGHVVLEVVREGSEILVHLTDDGAGINVDAVRKKAISQGLISANDTSLSDVDIMQYIFNAGLSTTSVVTQISGRGVGMDVVRSEIRQLGGSVSVDSVRGQGSRFTMRVPLTVAVSDTLVVRAADRQYAIPLVQIERVTQVSTHDLLKYYQSTNNTLDIDGVPYRLRYLNEILSGHDFSELLSNNVSFPVVLVKNQAGQNLALQVDEIVGSRIEVVVKPLGRQLSNVSGISAATIMGDGSVMFILDLMALLRNARARVAVTIATPDEANKRPVVLVVDDSVTVRKVTSRFLERQGFEAMVAKDGVDALEILQELTPDLMLLDIEMPRMDGFEVAMQVRRNPRLEGLPIIMITSRTGEKHRERAFEIGVTDYMGKPFQEADLLTRIQTHLGL